MRVIFDCNIYFQAFISPSGPAGLCLEAARLKRVELVYSDHVLRELRDICLRPKIAEKFQITSEQLDAYEAFVRGLGTLVDDIPHVFDYERDPKDEHYVDLAIAAGAKLLVTRDKDLLDLADTKNADGQRMRKNHPTLEVVGPLELLSRITAG